MATVRFSEELKNSILGNARNLYKGRLKEAKENYSPTWGTTVYNLMFKDTLATMNTLPTDYLRTSSEFTIAGFSDLKEINIKVLLVLGSELRFPYNVRIAGHGLSTSGQMSSYSGLLLDAADSRWDAFKVEYTAYCQAYMDIADEQDTFSKGVTAVIKAYTTLAPALKAWPALWDLLPDHTKDRHREIVERKKAGSIAGIEADTDLRKMTAAVTLGKITR
jgi:hypothetical protein